MQNQGKAALITGGARGIGRALAQGLVQRGCRVLVTDLIDPTNDSLFDASNDMVCFMRGDHSNMAHNRSAVERALAQFGRLDYLFNNAGVACQGAFAEISHDEVLRVVSANLIGPILMTQAALPALRENLDGDRAIIFTGSVQSLIARPKFGVYGATKHGIAGLVGSLALELAEGGIRVNGLCPGPVDTQVFRESMRAIEGDADTAASRHVASVPLKRMITVQEVVETALFLVSPGATGITGAMVAVDGGITAR